MRTFGEDALPEYIALSYVWGSYKHTERIIVNGHVLPITRNLHDFLRNIRSFKNTRLKDLDLKEYQGRPEGIDNSDCYPVTWFWADQISMDQQNTKERDHQVGLMSSIYKGAQVVFAYLGENSVPPFDFRPVPSPQLDPEDRRTYISHLRWLDIFTRPYWYRLWIVQEICFAPQVEFWLGGQCVSQSSLYDIFWRFCWAGHRICEVVNSGSDEETRKTQELIDKFHVDHLRGHYYLLGKDKPVASNLQKVLSDHSFRECTDPRDKVFGLQSLVWLDSQIQVDYSLPLSAILLRAIDKVLQIRSDSEPVRAGIPFLEHVHLITGIRGFGDLVSSTVPDKRLDGKILLEAIVLAWTIGDDPRWNIPFQGPLRPRSVLSKWREMWDGASRFAVTPKQQELLMDLAGSGCKHEIISILKKFDSQDQTELQADLMTERSAALSRWGTEVMRTTAKEHGFVMYGSYVAHPDEWPWPSHDHEPL